MAKKLDKVNTTSVDMGKENLNKLRHIFPEFVKDGEVDFDALREYFAKDSTLGGQEKYGLNWAGKSNAFKAIQIPATGTLVPQKDESKNWDTTENLFIEGDNLEVLKLLQKYYREKIKMIYIDPPYNRGKDFIYKDNFTENVSDYYERTGQTRGGIKMIANTEKNGRYHSDWLTMMYPRLFLARNLLKDDGVIFISIDDHEVANLRLIMDEIFGEENFITQLIWQKKTGASDSVTISTITEYILVYVKQSINPEQVFAKNKSAHDPERYSLTDEFLDERGPYYIDNLDRGGLQYSDSLNYPITCPDGTITYPHGRTEKINDGWIWKWSKEKLKWGIENKFIEFRKSKIKKGGWAVCYKNYLLVDNEGNKIERSVPIKNLITDVLNADAASTMKNLFGFNIFPYSKPVDLIKKILLFANNKNGDIVLDFFAGSGTTAHAIMDLNADDGVNRNFICIQLPEETEKDSEAQKAGFKNIAEIARERINRAGDSLKYKIKARPKTSEPTGKAEFKTPLPLSEKVKNLDIGFKALVLEKSNYRQWSVLTDKDNPEILKEQMKLFSEKPLVDKYDLESVVYEIFLKEGFDLNAKVSSEGNLWTVEDRERKMVISFAKKITQAGIEQLRLKEDDTFVCFDSALDDTVKVNMIRNTNIKVI